MNNYGHVTWAVRVDQPSASRLATAKTHGTLCALHFIWLGSLPLPISPYMFLLAITGSLPDTLDHSFMKHVNPELDQRLLQWPINSEPLDLATGSPVSQIIILFLQHVTVSCCDNFQT